MESRQPGAVPVRAGEAAFFSGEHPHGPGEQREGRLSAIAFTHRRCADASIEMRRRLRFLGFRHPIDSLPRAFVRIRLRLFLDLSGGDCGSSPLPLDLPLPLEGRRVRIDLLSMP